MYSFIKPHKKHIPWNKGKLIGQKQRKKYRYYITKSDEIEHQSLRYPAEQIERVVFNELIVWLKGQGTIEPPSRAKNINILKSGTPSDKRELLLKLIKSISLSAEKMDIFLTELSNSSDQDDVAKPSISVPISFSKGKIGKKIIIPSGQQIIQIPDKKLISLIAKAYKYANSLQSGKYKTMTELAQKHGINKSDLAKQIRFAYLAPDIVVTMMEGRQPTSLNATHLRRLRNLPVDWNEQRSMMNML